ncbi:MAG: DegV family protein [Clostridiales bacterium]|nr:DegV family protein [Clostridiales bacterium]
MPVIRIIADSSCDLRNTEYVKEFITVPVPIIFKERSFQDQGDINIMDYFSAMKQSPHFPQTSLPSPQSFINAFSAAEPADDIICITASSKISGIFNSANIAKRIAEEEGLVSARIHLVDSKNVSIGMALFIRTALDMVKNGEVIGDILARLEEMTRTVSMYFVLDTLKYAIKGGRLSGLKPMVGQLLNIKPVLYFDEGVVRDVDRIFKQKQIEEWLVKKFFKSALSFEQAAIAQGDALARAGSLEARLKAKAPGIRILIQEVGLAVGAYAGPGVIGIAFEEKNK